MRKLHDWEDIVIRYTEFTEDKSEIAISLKINFRTFFNTKQNNRLHLNGYIIILNAAHSQ